MTTLRYKYPLKASGTRIYILTIVLFFTVSLSFGQVLRVGIAGLSHDHVNTIMNQYKNAKVVIAGIVEADQELVRKYKIRFALPDSLFYKSLTALIDSKKPDAVLAFNAIADHLAVVEICAPKGISVMVEKPLATTVAQAQRMASLAKQYNIHLLTNYETTWYPSNHQLKELAVTQKSLGGIRKMVVHSGHQGPKEIGCSKEFLQWLTDPVKNGGGALTDFGCYGANLMTWLMKGKAPVAVTAVTKQIKPAIYPKVDDDATILLEYPDATGIIEASWNWPFGIKDMEVFGEKGYLHAVNSSRLQQKDKAELYNVNLQPLQYTDNLSYLAAALRGEITAPNDLSSLENNLIVVRILEAARISAREGKKIRL